MLDTHEKKNGLTVETSIRTLPLGDILDSTWFMLFDREFWGRSREGTHPNNKNQSMHKRMAFRIMTSIWKLFPILTVHQPPIERAIAQYGRSSLVNQVKKYLAEPIMSEGEHPGMRRVSYMEELALTLIVFIGSDDSLKRSFLHDGLYHRLIRRAWMVVKSDMGIAEALSALFYSVFDGWR